MIRLYQGFSRLTPRHCRFEPTCSHYAATSLSRHGLIQGTRLTIKRLMCCHPWHDGGYDPVPDVLDRSSAMVRS